MGASSSGGVVASAPQPPATGCDASGIHFMSQVSLIGGFWPHVFLGQSERMTHPSANDAGGMTDCSRWLSEAIPSGFVSVKRLAPRQGCKSFFASCSGGVVASAPQPPAKGCDASGIHFMSQVSLIGGFWPHVFLRQSERMTQPSANDAGGITDCSRWLSEATPSGFVRGNGVILV